MRQRRNPFGFFPTSGIPRKTAQFHRWGEERRVFFLDTCSLGKCTGDIYVEMVILVACRGKYSST